MNESDPLRSYESDPLRLSGRARNHLSDLRVLRKATLPDEGKLPELTRSMPRTSGKTMWRVVRFMDERIE